ncbi:hypothetical protein HZA86_04940 [Candidatus Uhrbacteria bacterium]|nr:hypothetical protein [Candidatus Uhrbacteria bacterium]
MLTETSQKFAKALFDIGSVKFGAFKLKLHETNPDAPLSPIYVDLRVLRSFPYAIRLAVDELKAMMARDGIKCDVLADLPTAATPIATLLMDRTDIPMITPKKDTKTHGISAKIEGVFQKGQTALMVDDLVTKADTKVEGANALREAGLVVNDVVVLVDREQGGTAELKEHGVTLHAVMTLSDMLAYYKESGMITAEMYDKVRGYLVGQTGVPAAKAL